MYNSEFEKQVQEKMEGLKMTPSDNMWDRIENDLPGKPRCKKPVLLLLLLLGGCGLVWMLSQVNNSQADRLSASEKIQKADSVNKSKNGGVVLQEPDKKDRTGKLSNAQKADTSKLYPFSEQKPVLTATDAEKTGQENNIGNDRNTVKQVNAKPIPGSQRVIKSTATGIADTNDEPAGSKTQPGYLVSKKARTKITVMQQPMNDEISMPSDDEILSPSEPFTASLIHNQPASMNKNLLPRKWLAEPIAAAASFAKPVNKKGRGKWEYGIMLAGGLSRQTSNPFTANNNSPSAFGVTGITADSFTRRKALIATKPSVAFEAGFYILNRGAKKWSIQTGLHYSYMSYKRAVGKKVDSVRQSYFLNNPVTLNNFYQTGSERNYINKVHLLQLPFEVQYSPGRKNNWRILGGIAAGFLLQSNALVFVNNPEGYVPGNEVIKVTGKGAFNKFTVSLHTGIGFYHQKGLPFSAGLRLNYGAIPFTKKYISNQHLLSSVLFVNIPLKK
jgi:Outer membrane protein beta-barrel domain